MKHRALLSLPLTAALVAIVLLTGRFSTQSPSAPSVSDGSQNDDAARARYEKILRHVRSDSPEAFQARRKLEKLDRGSDPQARFGYPDEFARILAEMRVPADRKTHEYKPGYRQREIQKGMQFASPKAPLPWTSRGPYNVSGRARGIIVDSADATNNTWFVGSVGGGIWKTTNAGATWSNLTPSLSRTPISWLVQATTNPDVMYAGTGEGFYNVDTINGEGLLKSIDHGDTWTPIASTLGDLDYQNITRIIVDPNDEDILVASAVTGFYAVGTNNESQIFRSIDGGANWAPVYSETDTFPSGRIKRVTQVIATPGNFNVQFAAVDSKGILKSIDGGQSWSFSGAGITDSTGRFEIAISTVNTSRVFASAEGPSHSELWVSDNAGATWWESVESGTEPNWLGAQGWYDNTIVCHPTDEDIVYVGGIRIWKITLTSGTNRTTSLLSTSPSHVDNHNLVILDDGGGNWRILNANDGGIGVSGNQDANWSKPTDGMVTGQFYGADKRPGQDAYAGGMQDNGTWVSPINTTNSDPWTFAIGGDGYEVSWNFNDPTKIIGGYQFNGLMRSLDGGQTWEGATNGLSDTGGGSAPFITKIAKSKDATERLFAVGAQGVWRSEDFGGSWSLVPLSAPDWPGVSSFLDVRFSRADPDVIWAGGRMDATGKMHVSVDGGLNFASTNNYVTATMGGISGLATHPTLPGTAFVLFSYAQRPKILRTDDFGTNWTDISGFGAGSSSTNGFPDVAVYDLIVMPDDPNTIWVGSEIGIIESVDGGATWALANNGWGNVPIWFMTHVEDEIVVASHGRGVWSVEMPNLVAGEIFNPLLETVFQGPDGDLSIGMTLRSAYDKTVVLVNGAGIDSLGTNVAKLVTSVQWPVSMDQTVTVQIRSTVGVDTYLSPSRQIQVYALNDPLFTYVNDFNAASSDFAGSGFSVIQPGGFSNPAIHSTHDYPDGAVLTYVLKQPIVIAPSNATIEFDEIAIVEPGEPGATFQDVDFWDYVVVEGSLDGTNWIPFEDGWDCNADLAWRSAFDSSSNGNSSMYRFRSLDMLNRFNPSDHVLIRFRLFADGFVNSWGWAIDNLSIQGGLTQAPERPLAFGLEQNAPNPFNPVTTIHFSLPRTGEASLKIYDLRGRLVRTLFDGPQQAGARSVEWNGTDGGGARVSSGIYLYRLVAGEHVEQKKLTLLK
jgi:hypothetical protein